MKLCPCGSGLTRGACCGKKEQSGDAITRARQAAYTGELGRRRESFCRDYISYKEAAIAGMVSGLRQEAVKARGEITCGRGCTPCCHVYVVASLQECEAIVYYLYRHAVALQHFVAAHQTWRAEVEKIRDTFFEISRLQQKRMSHENSPQDDEAFNAELIKYSALNLPCPFLKNGVCSIYGVRPYVCAGLVSTTPGEWCRPGHAEHNRIKLLKAEVALDRDMPYFANPGGKVSLTNMPALVYEILRYGWDFLARVPGQEYLREAISNDMERRS